MYNPRKDSRREKVLQIVNESGGITAEQILKTHGTMGFLNVWAITTELRKLARYRCINQEGNVFFAVAQEKPVYKSDPKDLVPPREAMPFVPLKILSDIFNCLHYSVVCCFHPSSIDL